MLINNSIEASTFPNFVKEGNAAHVYKKQDSMAKENYRPVSILPQLSKVFEQVMTDQILAYFSDILFCHLSAFRSGYSCQDPYFFLPRHGKAL